MKQQNKRFRFKPPTLYGKLFGIASTIKGANIIFFTPPSIPGFGFAGGFEVNLLDRFGGEFTELDKVNKELNRLRSRAY